MKDSQSKTLLFSILTSAPGPLVVGLGLLAGKSSTQLADFLRRSSELLAIVAAYVAYRITLKNGFEPEKKARVERVCNLFCGGAMAIAGALMILVACLSENGEKGNVIPGLCIAALGVLANSLFFFKYSRLNAREPNPIIAVQARLYGAKSLVDGCVCIALFSVAIAPKSPVSYYLDFIGSIVVASYLLWCGVKTIAEKIKK